MLPLMSVRSTGCWPLLKWHSTASMHQVLHTRHPARRCGPSWWQPRGMGARILPRLSKHAPCRRCAGPWTVDIEDIRFDGCAFPAPLSLLVASFRAALVRNGMLADVSLQQSVAGRACTVCKALSCRN